MCGMRHLASCTCTTMCRRGIGECLAGGRSTADIYPDANAHYNADSDSHFNPDRHAPAQPARPHHPDSNPIFTPTATPTRTPTLATTPTQSSEVVNPANIANLEIGTNVLINFDNFTSPVDGKPIPDLYCWVYMEFSG